MNRRIIAVYPGRFQPFHASHYAVYLYLVRRFGKQNVYIVTSNKTQKGRSPFTFKQKQSIISRLYGISTNNIIMSPQPYRVDTYMNRFISNSDVIVFPVTGKDADRMKPGKFIKGQIDKFKNVLQPMQDAGYTYKIPLMFNKVRGKEVSGTSVRQLLGSSQYDIEQKKKIFRQIFGKYDQSIFQMLTGKLSQNLIVEGAAGHMAHIFDQTELTFKDFKQIINMLLSGNIHVEAQATMKYDGQNIMVTWKNNKLVAARNKGHMRNFGQKALDASKMRAFFSGRGQLQKAFVFAMIDLHRAIGQLSDGIRNGLFEEGKKWLNLQILYPPTANVIPYDVSMLVFHNITQINQKGDTVSVDNTQAQAIYSALVQVNANVQKHFGFIPPTVVELPKTQNFAARKNYYLGRLARLQSKYKLSGNSTLQDYNDAFWKQFITQVASSIGYKVPKNVMDGLLTRWSQFNKSYSVNHMKRQIQDEAFLTWARKFDKQDHRSIAKQNAYDWQILFMQLTAQVLQNLTQFMVANPDRAIQKLRSDLQKTIQQIRNTSDPRLIRNMQSHLRKIEAIGGIQAIVPTQGIVFTYKGRTLKMTGLFSSVNQILGALKYAR